MKKLIALLSGGWLLLTGVAFADTLNLNGVSGAPGETVTVILSSDGIALANNLFTADVTVGYDPAVLDFQGFRQVSPFTAPPAQFATVNDNDAGGSLGLLLNAQYPVGQTTLAAGNLLELDFLILTSAQGGNATLTLSAESEANDITAGTNGTVTVITEVVTVPVPPLALAIGLFIVLTGGYVRSKRAVAPDFR